MTWFNFLNELLSDSVQLLCLIVLERISKPFSVDDTHNTANCLFNSSWRVHVVKSSSVHFSVFIFADGFCNISLFIYRLRQSCSVPESSSRSIPILAVRKAARCASLSVKVWIRCSRTKLFALERVTDDSCARPYFYKEWQSNQIEIVTRN